MVTTVAGTSTDGEVDGNGKQARFLMLSNLTIDKTGNILAVDGAAVRKVTFV